MTDQAFLAWGWRIPFLVSVVLIALGLYVQLRLEDTAAFRELRALKERRDAEAAAERARQLGDRASRRPSAESGRGTPAVAGTRGHAGLPEADCARGGLLRRGPGDLLYPGRFRDRVWQRPLRCSGSPASTMLVGVLIGAVVMIPGVIVPAIRVRSVWPPRRDHARRRGAGALGIRPLPADRYALAALDLGRHRRGAGRSSGRCTARRRPFSPRSSRPACATRARRSATRWAASSAGGLAPIIATALLARYGKTTGISVYMALACLVSFVSVWWLKETYRNTM